MSKDNSLESHLKQMHPNVHIHPTGHLKHVLKSEDRYEDKRLHRDHYSKLRSLIHRLL